MVAKPPLCFQEDIPDAFSFHEQEVHQKKALFFLSLFIYLSAASLTVCPHLLTAENA
jgi:hypothetical protein